MHAEEQVAVDLRLPDLCYVVILLESAAAAQVEEWACHVTPWTRLPGDTEGGILPFGETRFHGDHGETVVRVTARAFANMGPSARIEYLTPRGLEFEIFGWSPKYDLQPENAHVQAPSHVALSSVAKGDGVWVHTQPPEDALAVHLAAHDGPATARWSHFLGYGGRCFVPLPGARSQRAADLEVRLPSGEIFQREVAGPTDEPILLVAGKGQAPLVLTLPPAATVASVWYLLDSGAPAQIEPASLAAGSARQFHVEGNRLVVSLPAALQRSVWAFLENGAVVASQDVGTAGELPGFQVVPPTLVVGLNAQESLLVELEANMGGAGGEHWVRVWARRYRAGEVLGEFAVRSVLGVRWRTRWSKVVERQGAFTTVESGTFDPTGAGGYPAQVPRGR